MAAVPRTLPSGPEVGHGRRERIITTACHLASAGGYDAVQMRTVAHQTPVALATLYRHFPSKTHLLLAVLTGELERAQDRLDRQILRGSSPYDRVMGVVAPLTRSMQRSPRLTEATMRGLMLADGSAVREVNNVRELIDEQFARGISVGEPDADQLAIGGVIGDVWLATLTAWTSHRVGTEDVLDRLALSIRLVLGHTPVNELF
jgi:AcrR family transcriptional regulator